MAELEDVLLSQSGVAKFIEEILGKNVKITREARAAVASAASVFLQNLTSVSGEIAAKDGRRRLRGEDMIAALKDWKFCDWKLEEELERYQLFHKEESPSENEKVILDDTETDAETEPEIEQDTEIEFQLGAKVGIANDIECGTEDGAEQETDSESESDSSDSSKISEFGDDEGSSSEYEVIEIDD